MHYYYYYYFWCSSSSSSSSSSTSSCCTGSTTTTHKQNGVRFPADTCGILFVSRDNPTSGGESVLDAFSRPLHSYGRDGGWKAGIVIVLLENSSEAVPAGPGLRRTATRCGGWRSPVCWELSQIKGILHSLPTENGLCCSCCRFVNTHETEPTRVLHVPREQYSKYISRDFKIYPISLVC